MNNPLYDNDGMKKLVAETLLKILCVFIWALFFVLLLTL